MSVSQRARERRVSTGPLANIFTVVLIAALLTLVLDNQTDAFLPFAAIGLGAVLSFVAGWRCFLFWGMGKRRRGETGPEVNRTELRDDCEEMLEGWVRLLDLRAAEPEAHAKRVAEMAALLAASMGMSGDAFVNVRCGALLHDIGKLGIPDSILLKQGTLTKDERRIMQRHPLCAREIVGLVRPLRSAMDIPCFHHERWDGSGYPNGLAGETIPLPARIFSVVDVYDALCSDKPYRSGWPRERVMEYLRLGAGTQFDPAVVEKFFALLMTIAKEESSVSLTNRTAFQALPGGVQSPSTLLRPAAFARYSA